MCFFAEICPIGQFVNANNICQQCLKGTFRSDLSNDSCQICPDGLTTTGPGADSSDDCSLSKFTIHYNIVYHWNIYLTTLHRLLALYSLTVQSRSKVRQSDPMSANMIQS